MDQIFFPIVYFTRHIYELVQRLKFVRKWSDATAGGRLVVGYIGRCLLFRSGRQSHASPPPPHFISSFLSRYSRRSCSRRPVAGCFPICRSWYDSRCHCATGPGAGRYPGIHRDSAATGGEWRNHAVKRVVLMRWSLHISTAITNRYSILSSSKCLQFLYKRPIRKKF